MGNIFKILLDAAGDAFALSKVVLGQAITGALNGIAAYSFRDSSGNATMPSLNDEGALPVTFDAGTTQVIAAKYETQANMESAGIGVRVLLGSIALIENRTYTCPSFDGSALREMKFELVKVEDVGGGGEAEELILGGTISAGQTFIKGGHKLDKFSTDASVNTKEVRLYATMLESKAGGDVYGKATFNLTAAS